MWMQIKMFLKFTVRKKNQNKFGSIKIFFLYLWKQNKTQMKKEQIIEKFFEDMTTEIKNEVMSSGITEPKAIVLTTDGDGDYCVCGTILPSSFDKEMSIEKMMMVKSIIQLFIQQVISDGHEIHAVIHSEFIESWNDTGEHLFLFKKFWDSEDEIENNKNITTEFLKINRNGVFVSDDGELVHDIELEKV
jgi:hypothetical protein